jgi:fructokinase
MRIGVDLGGTKIEAIALADSGDVVARLRVETPRTYDATIAAIGALVDAVEQHAGERGTVGVGIPGAVVPDTGLVKNANSVWLIGRPLGRDLETALGRPVRVENDANCFAISEASDGAAQGARVVFGVILGTGVGGGIVIDGRCLDGVNLIAGEWGHNPLPWMTPEEYPGPECYCGKRGCVEMFLSGPGFATAFVSGTGESASPSEIVSRAESGDAPAMVAVTRYHDRLARGLASVINLLDPDVIVLGGGMSNMPELAESVSGRFANYVFSDRVATRVVRNKHGDSSGVRGAAWLWPLERPAR